MVFGWTLNRLERLSVHVSYLRSINHDSNLRPYLLGLVVSRVHTDRHGTYLFLTKLRIRLSDPRRPPGSYFACTSIEHGHPLSGNTLIASLSMMIHYSLLISPTSQKNVGCTHHFHILSMPVCNFAPSQLWRSLRS
jgi:hypothetical protein